MRNLKMKKGLIHAGSKCINGEKNRNEAKRKENDGIKEKNERKEQKK